jgi:K+-sensing histidine kinase KdpD
MATVALAAVLFMGTERIGFRIPNPVLIFALAIVASAYLGGVAAGLLSVGVTFLYTLLAWSAPGHLFSYSPDDVRRLLVQAVTMPSMALLVGALHARHERRIEELAEALERVKQLEGLIPICSYCKKVRDDSGLWERIEAYLSSRSNVTFTHGICPDCEGKIDY